MRTLKGIFFLIALAVIILMACYFFQPLKKGKRIDHTTSYTVSEQWLHLPANIRLGNPTGIDIDSGGNLVVFHRANRSWPLIGAMPANTIDANTVLVINPVSGKLVNSWGRDLFIMPHGLTIDQHNNTWLTDVGLHQVFKYDSKGVLLMKLGVAKQPGNDSLHFNMPTDVAVAKDGSVYISDGYGNSRIVKYSANGKYLLEWGTKGDANGEFDIPHGIDLDDAGNVYVADRENSRVQVFNANGKFLKAFERDDVGSICAVKVIGKTIYATDDVRFLQLKHRGSDVLLLDSAGSMRSRFGRSGNPATTPGWFHDICIDHAGNIYAGDILNNTILKFSKLR